MKDPFAQFDLNDEITRLELAHTRILEAVDRPAKRYSATVEAQLGRLSEWSPNSWQRLLGVNAEASLMFNARVFVKAGRKADEPIQMPDVLSGLHLIAGLVASLQRDDPALARDLAPYVYLIVGAFMRRVIRDSGLPTVPCAAHSRVE